MLFVITLNSLTNPKLDSLFKAVGDHCKWVTKCYIPHPQSKNKVLEVNVIPEGDLYRLVGSSELPNVLGIPLEELVEKEERNAGTENN